MSRRLSATQEDYLEAILQLIVAKGAARVRDIADALGVHKSTVTAALKSLSEKGFVQHSPYELTTLTGSGRRIAEAVVRKHDLIASFLRDVLKVDPETAERNACRMEHVIEAAVLERLVDFLDGLPVSARNDYTPERGS